jgi:hypothetical protein
MMQLVNDWQNLVKSSTNLPESPHSKAVKGIEEGKKVEHSLQALKTK